MVSLDENGSSTYSSAGFSYGLTHGSTVFVLKVQLLIHYIPRRHIEHAGSNCSYLNRKHAHLFLISIIIRHAVPGKAAIREGRYPYSSPRFHPQFSLIQLDIEYSKNSNETMHHMLPLVSHNLSVLRTVGVGRLGICVNFHVVATLAGLTLTLLLLLNQLVFTLALDVNAAILRHLILLDTVLNLGLPFSIVLNALHGSILPVSGLGGAVGVRRAGAFDLILLFLGQLVSAVLVAIGDQIGLWLLWGELCGS
jgi:hypothetical protein